MLDIPYKYPQHAPLGVYLSLFWDNVNMKHNPLKISNTCLERWLTVKVRRYLCSRLTESPCVLPVSLAMWKG